MFNLKKALFGAVSVIFISTISYAGEIGHVPISSHILSHTLELKPTSSLEYQLAKSTFLPDSFDDLGLSGHENTKYDHNQGDNCSGYDLTSCPAHGNCSSCSFNRKLKKLNSCASGYSRNGNSCSASSCSAAGYESSIPANKICTKVTEGSLTCYKDCRPVSCSGYTLNCDTFNVANSSGKTMCPDCNSANASCSPKHCKVSGCMDGFKIADNGTTCVELDDTCPADYFKTCETGTQGDPEYTDKGTACYQCKAKPTSEPQAGDILYSDLTTSSEVISGKTPIGVVFDAQKKLAVALNYEKKTWSTESFDIPELTNYSRGNEAGAKSDWKGKENTQTIIDYCSSSGKSCPAAEYANNYTTKGTSAKNWYLPAFGELNAIYNAREAIETTMAKIGGTTLAENRFWSSSEHSYACCSWYKRFNTSNAGYDNKDSTLYFALPIINYGYVKPAGELLILYSDLTTSTEVIAGKTPIGVVFDAEKKLAVALTATTAKWSTEAFNIPELTDYSSEPFSDWNGKENTKTIVNYCSSNGKSCPAAEYANSFTTTGTSAGDWYLPAFGELNAIYVNMTKVNEKLTKIQGTMLSTDNAFWSSNERNDSNSWEHAFFNSLTGNISKTASRYVRPIINYGDILGEYDAECHRLKSGSRYCGGIDPYTGQPPYCIADGQTTLTAGRISNAGLCWECPQGYSLHCITSSKPVSYCDKYVNDKCVACYMGSLTPEGTCK